MGFLVNTLNDFLTVVFATLSALCLVVILALIKNGSVNAYMEPEAGLKALFSPQIHLK